MVKQFGFTGPEHGESDHLALIGWSREESCLKNLEELFSVLCLSLAHWVRLHRNPTNSNMDRDTQRLWNWLWWSLYARGTLIALDKRWPMSIEYGDSYGITRWFRCESFLCKHPGHHPYQHSSLLQKLPKMERPTMRASCVLLLGRMREVCSPTKPRIIPGLPQKPFPVLKISISRQHTMGNSCKKVYSVLSILECWKCVNPIKLGSLFWSIYIYLLVLVDFTWDVLSASVSLQTGQRCNIIFSPVNFSCQFSIEK